MAPIGGALGNRPAARLQALNSLAVLSPAPVNTAQAEGLTPAARRGGRSSRCPPPASAAGSNTGSATSPRRSPPPADCRPMAGPSCSAPAPSWTATDQASGQVTPAQRRAAGFAGLTATISGAAAPGDSSRSTRAPGAAAASASPRQPTRSPPPTPMSHPGHAAKRRLHLRHHQCRHRHLGTDTRHQHTGRRCGRGSGGLFRPESANQLHLQHGLDHPHRGNPARPRQRPAGRPMAALSPSPTQPGGRRRQYWQLPLSGTPATGDAHDPSPGGSQRQQRARMASLWTAPGTSTAGTLQQASSGLPRSSAPSRSRRSSSPPQPQPSDRGDQQSAKHRRRVTPTSRRCC